MEFGVGVAIDPNTNMVHLSLFPEPSLVLFAEQANIVNLNQPYRPRFIQLRHSPNSESGLEAQYYMPQNLTSA